MPIDQNELYGLRFQGQFSDGRPQLEGRQL